MKRTRFGAFVFAAVLTILFGCIAYLIYTPSAIEVFSPARFSDATVVIDAGHGGEDGGAVSVTGAIESHINLEIALKLDEIFGLYGVNTVLLRDKDISLHDADAETLRQKKVSDLHNRVSMINSTENPIVISIHQNTYSSSQYHGAQVFYANGELSFPFAEITQNILIQVLDPTNNRKPTTVPDSVYLMNNISCKAILVECGFLSNYQEDALLQTSDYQTKISVALAGSYLNYQQSVQEGETIDAS